MNRTCQSYSDTCKERTSEAEIQSSNKTPKDPSFKKLSLNC